MPVHSPARQCTDLAAAAAPAMIGRAIDQAIVALQEEEQRCQGVAQRRELADAWLELSKRRNEWAQRYPVLLRAAQAAQELPAPAKRTAAPSTEGFGALSLVDDDSVSLAIESARVLQLLAPRLEQPLAELDTLMSTALGLQTVQPERNPLRPEVFATSLRDLMQPAQRPQWPAIWSRHLAGPLATGIAALYRDALKILQDARLEAASYRVLPIASPAATAAPAAARPQAPPTSGDGGHTGANAAFTSGSGGAFAPAVPGPSAAADAHQAGSAQTPALGGPAWADLSNFALGDELFQQFLFAQKPPSTQALAPAYFAQVGAQVAALESQPLPAVPYDAQAVQRTRALPAVERPHRPVTSTSALDDKAWAQWAAPQQRELVRTRLKGEARHVGQVLGLEVVRKLVDQVGCDQRLLAPVREAVVALEPALGRLALVAPRFFAQENHAGRRLVERVAERSFRYNDEFSSEFQDFFTGVRSAFHALNEKGVESEAPFTSALGQLEQRWSAEDVLDDRGRQVAVDAVHFAEAREAEAGRIAWGLSQRADLDGVPAVVQDFLYGPWSLVMAHARLTDPTGAIDPGGWSSVITELLWSVKSEQTLREPGRLITTIPGMLEKLRGGIEVLGQQPGDHESFFATLEKSHSPVLQLRARQRRGKQPVLPERQLGEALLSTKRQQPKARAGDPWMTPVEKQAAGFDAEPASTPAALAQDAAAPVPIETGVAAAASATLDPAEMGRVIDSLHEGCWVDLCAHGRWRRASLTWVSSRASLFMFVSHGGRPHSMTRRSLERLVRDRLLRPVTTGAVVAKALDALSQQRGGDAAPVAPPRTQRASAGGERLRLEPSATLAA
ncbi:MAG: hypothetical protein JWP41_2112 [Ramlibacter sp.]|nr:hypothetical protein [Ramlibacter sp.]